MLDPEIGPTATPTVRRTFGRRQLLAAGGASAVSALLATAGLASAAGPSGLAGYVTGSETSTPTRSSALLGTSPIRVVPAATVVPDPSLGQAPFNLVAYGFFPAKPSPVFVSWAALDVIYPSAGPSGQTFRVWQFTNGKVPRSSPNARIAIKPVAGVLPVLRLSVADGRGVARTLVTPLTIDPKGTGAKLRRGLYLLAAFEGAWAAPLPVNPAYPQPTNLLSLVVGVGLPDLAAPTRALGGVRRTTPKPVNALTLVRPGLGRAPLIR